MKASFRGSSVACVVYHLSATQFQKILKQGIEAGYTKLPSKDVFTSDFITPYMHAATNGYFKKTYTNLKDPADYSFVVLDVSNNRLIVIISNS
jgi:hypothetical protein